MFLLVARVNTLPVHSPHLMNATRSLGMAPLTSTDPYIKFSDSTECNRVWDNWNAAGTDCYFANYCDTDSAILVTWETTTISCIVETTVPANQVSFASVPPDVFAMFTINSQANGECAAVFAHTWGNTIHSASCPSGYLCMSCKEDHIKTLILKKP